MIKNWPKRMISWKRLILPLLAGLFYLGYLWFHQVGKTFANQALREIINRSVSEHYLINYAQLDIDLWEKKLLVKDLLLTPDSSLLLQPKNKLYSIKIPRFDIQLKSIIPIFRDKELIIEGLSITDPEIIVADYFDKNNLTITSESISLFELINQYLDLFKIDFLDIQQAEFSYLKKHRLQEEMLFLEHIDLNLRQFALDSTLTKHNFLNAQSVELIIHNQTLFLPDHIHQLSFERFRLSTQDSSLAFEQVHLHPIDTAMFKDAQVSDEHHIYDLSFPAIQLKGLDFQGSYVNGDIRMDQLALQKPDIFVQQRFRENTTENAQNNAVLAILAKFASSLQINEIHVDQAAVLFTVARQFKDRLSFDVDSLQLFDFFLDTEDLYFNNKKPPISGFDLSIQNIHKYWPNQQYSFNAGQIVLNSQKANLLAKKLTFKPLRLKPHPKRSKIIQEIPEIRFSKVNFMDALFGEDLTFRQIWVDQPVTTLIPPLEKPDSARTGLSLDPLRQLFTNTFLKGINGKQLVVNDGAFYLNTTLQIDHYYLEKNDLKLGPNITSWKAVMHPFSLDVQQTTFRHQDLSLELADYKSDGKDHYLENVAFKVENQDFKVRKITFFHSDLDSLLAGKAAFDSILLEQAFAKINLPLEKRKENQNLGSAFDLPLKTPAIILNQAHLDLRLPHENHLTIDSLDGRWRADSILTLQEIAFKNFHFLGNNFQHELTVNRLTQINQTDSYQLTDVRVNPMDTNLAWRVPLHIPKLQLYQLDRKKLLKDRAISVQKIGLERPSLALKYLQDSSFQKISSTPKLWPLIKVDTLSVADGQFRLETIANTDTNQIKLPNSQVEILGFNTQGFKGGVQQIAKLYKSFTFENDSLLTFKDSNILVHIHQPRLVAPEGHFSFPYLQIADKQRQVQSTLLGTKVHAFQIPIFLKKGIIQMDSLLIDKASLGLRVQGQADKVSFKRLPKSLALGFGPLSIKKMRIGALSLGLFQKDTLQLDQIYFQADGLALDSTIVLEHLDHYYQNLAVDLPHFKLTVGKHQEYSLSQGLHFDSKKRQLAMTGIQLKPKYDREAYSQIIDYQTDHFDVQLDSITFHHFSPADIFKSPLEFKKIAIHQVDADIYRDRNVSRLQKQVPLVQTQIKSIPYPFGIDSLQFTGDFLVTELPASGQEPTIVRLNQIEGTLTHLTNVKNRLDTPMVLKAQGKFYNSGRFQTKVNFAMNDSLDAFTMTGVVDRMEIPPFNALLIPGARIHVKSGRNKGLTFNMSANEEHAIGEMIFRYNRLKILIGTKEDINKVNFGNSILSFWANRLVKSKNPSFLRKRVGVIYFERAQNKAIFNFWSKSLLSGVVSSVGVKNNKKQLKHLGEENLKLLHYHELFSDPWKIKNKH